MFNFKKKKETSKPEQRVTVKEHYLGNGAKAIEYEIEANTPEVARVISSVVSSVKELAKYDNYVDVAMYAAFIRGTLCGFECSGILEEEVADKLNDLVERAAEEKICVIRKREEKHGNNEETKEAGKEETVRADEECGEEDKGEK